MNPNENIKASVIVLAYNDRQYLEACLSSLFDQELPLDEYEVIYADNASTDGSADYVAERFPQARLLRFEKNYGFAEGNNRAAQQARGRYIVFQNADTVAHRRWLSELLKAFETDSQVKACHPPGLPLNFGGYHERERMPDRGVMCELTRFGYVDFTEKPLSGSPEPTLFIAGGSLAIDSHIFNQLQYYFDPSYFIYNEDTDLGLRINNLGYKILFVPTAPCYHQRASSRRTHLNRKTIRMAFLVTRNRFITFYKNMYALEFLWALPLIFVGSIVKLRTLPMSAWKKVIYGLGLLPFTVFALVAAVLRFPKYTRNRDYILHNRVHKKFWLFRELWKRPVPPWTPLSIGVSEA